MSKPERAPSYHINCRDRRLLNLIEQVFSSEMKIPSLKFSLLCSYAAFIGLCMVGMMTESTIPQVASVIKVAMLVWFGVLAGMLSPLFYFASQHEQSPWVLVVFLPLILLIVPLWKYLRQPSSMQLDEQGLHATWSQGALRWSKFYAWDEIRKIYFYSTQDANTDEWRFCLSTDNKELFSVRLGCMTGHADRVQLLDYAQKFCPLANIDHRILQAWTPAHSNSYTEIWLQSLAAPPKRARLAPLDEGMLLQDGKYQIKNVLASGGQAVVYLAMPSQAKSDESGQTLVLKEMIIPIYGDENLRRRELERFERESRLLSNLECDNIVKLIDYFIEDHRGYLVMEYIAGDSLISLVSREGALKESQVLELAEQMCTTLGYLHGLSPAVVHRDFTPDNLILTKDGVVKLIDFNVAQEAKFTTTATVVGKHAYLPPEQFRGKPCPQSDVYALGGTLFFLLTGTEPEPISSSAPILVNDNVSAEMNRIVAKATEPELKDRYASVAEMQADLRALAGNGSQVG